MPEQALEQTELVVWTQKRERYQQRCWPVQKWSGLPTHRLEVDQKHTTVCVMLQDGGQGNNNAAKLSAGARISNNTQLAFNNEHGTLIAEKTHNNSSVQS